MAWTSGNIRSEIVEGIKESPHIPCLIAISIVKCWMFMALSILIFVTQQSLPL